VVEALVTSVTATSPTGPFVDPAALIAEALQSWRPPPRLKLSEWADQHYMLSADAGAAEPGRWHTLPYQREPMDCFSDPLVERISVKKSARVGYTNWLLAAIGYYIHHDPCAMMVIQPTITDAKGFSKESVAPMLRDVAVLAEKFPPSVERKNSMLHKRFAGGLLQLVGARSPASFRRVGRRVLFGDEVDDYPPSAGSEGDPIALAIRRTEYFWNRKLSFGSTPTDAGASRIEELFGESDQRYFYVPCPHCGHAAPFVFRRDVGEDEAQHGPTGHFMDWPAGHPEQAHFVCRSCGAEIVEAYKRSMIEEADRAQCAGQPNIGWVPHAPFTGHAGFHVWAAYSYSPNATWADIAKEAEASDHSPEKKKTFVNTMLGETSKDAVDAPDWEVLYNRRDTYAIGTCPRGVLFLTCGVDVQKDRLEYEIVGWGRGKRSWSIEVDVLPCNTSDADAIKAHIDALLDRTFRHEFDAELAIQMLAIDSGFNTQIVYTVGRQYPLSRVIAVKGTDRAGVLVGLPSKVDVTLGGHKTGYRVWPVAVSVAKTELYGWLKLKAPLDTARAEGAIDPPGYCRFPPYGEAYFKQLVSEQLVAQRTGNGYALYTWTLPPGRENHALDCRNYARAAAAVKGIDRFSERQWNELENALTPPPDSAPPAPTASGPASAPAPTPPATAANKPFIPPRPGWMRRSRS
jgi:phage terminase large subunit GpA-like protein